MFPLPTDLFDYELPARLIAQVPEKKRDASRLLVVHRADRRIEHRVFTDIGDYLRPGDTLFRNNAAVLPARLLARRPSGGAVECLLLRPTLAGEENEWWCLLRPGKKLPLGATFGLAGVFVGTVLEKDAEGAVRVRFVCEAGLDGRPSSIVGVANRVGEVPLPPYIERQHTAAERAVDLERYQTVYANAARQVAAAAPTAGLHFTPELIARLSAAGIGTADVTLHVGLGTFKPISTVNIAEHAIHREVYEVPSATSRAALYPAAGTRRVAVGTTTVRTLEDFYRKHGAKGSALGGAMESLVDEAAIYLYPPTQFAVVDALVTNFHQPRSTLLCLVSAFLTPGSSDGIVWLKQIYAEAIAREYRFFSYGDAMLIL